MKFCETMSRQQVQKPLAMSLLLLFSSPLKIGQNSAQKHPEYKRIVWDKVSPLHRAVAVDAASSFSMALPLQTLPGLMETIYTGEKTLRCLKPGHQFRWCLASIWEAERGHLDIF